MVSNKNITKWLQYLKVKGAIYMLISILFVEKSNIFQNQNHNIEKFNKILMSWWLLHWLPKMGTEFKWARIDFTIKEG